MRDLSKYTDEELQHAAIKIENKLHSDDRCQPMSGAEILKLEAERFQVIKELRRRGYVYD